MSRRKMTAADRCFEGMTRLIQADHRLFGILFRHAKAWEPLISPEEASEIADLLEERMAASREMGVGADLLTLEGVVTWPPLPPKAGGGA